mmetsp:Transcript_3059/g.9561  ORF Transcript_3059/g.9561 Transcript_3059/m.9561 type:complete len:617 (-) Transcript_3059:99-1949(-)
MYAVLFLAGAATAEVIDLGGWTWAGPPNVTARGQAGVLLAKEESDGDQSNTAIFGAFARPKECSLRTQGCLECSLDGGATWRRAKSLHEFKPGAGHFVASDDRIDWSAVTTQNVGLDVACGRHAASRDACVHGLRVACSGVSALSPPRVGLRLRLAAGMSGKGKRRQAEVGVVVWQIESVPVRASSFPLGASECESTAGGALGVVTSTTERVSVVMPYLYPGADGRRALGHLTEWVGWYSLLGASRILLFDQQLSPPTGGFARGLEALAASNKRVLLLRGWWSPRLYISRRYQVFSLNLALSAVRGCASAARAASGSSPAEWVLSLDLDEFVYPVPAAQARSFLRAPQPHHLQRDPPLDAAPQRRPWRLRWGRSLSGALLRLAAHLGEAGEASGGEASGGEASGGCRGPASVAYLCRVDYYAAEACSGNSSGGGGLEAAPLRVGPPSFEAGPSSGWRIWGRMDEIVCDTTPAVANRGIGCVSSELKTKWMVDVAKGYRAAGVHDVRPARLEDDACAVKLPLEHIHLRHANHASARGCSTIFRGHFKTRTDSSANSSKKGPRFGRLRLTAGSPRDGVPTVKVSASIFFQKPEGKRGASLRSRLTPGVGRLASTSTSP